LRSMEPLLVVALVVIVAAITGLVGYRLAESRPSAAETPKRGSSRTSTTRSASTPSIPRRWPYHGGRKQVAKTLWRPSAEVRGTCLVDFRSSWR